MAQPSDGVGRSDRREFLARVSAAAVAGLCTGDVAAGDALPSDQLPTIALGGHRVSRLIVGSNPISGYSYLGKHAKPGRTRIYGDSTSASYMARCCFKHGGIRL